jgi:hypothetical protein
MSHFESGKISNRQFFEKHYDTLIIHIAKLGQVVHATRARQVSR